ncbi:MAG: Asp-tRNA(Asn)/Glu-tRNA(Gln) amidotransferase subunit GatB [Gemmataceae bacterium]
MPELPYRVVVGLEVHVQLLTRTKLFCGCGTAFGAPPNSQTCPVCLGLPGSLPVMNRKAFELSLRAALALNCDIARFTKWDRKNYYYPDLPKNYQISQYDLPLGSEGWLEVETGSGTKKVGIIRCHLEEDAGKLLHDEQGRGGDSLVDLNRTGTPLLEIVSKPELSSPEEAKVYLEEMALLMRELGVSDCEMQEGSLRCDANVNVHVPQPGGGHAATPIVEIKNLNSFRFLERAIRHEAQRQYEEWQRDKGYLFGKVSKATAGWDDAYGRTVFQRRKEEAADYRYFPDPDLAPVVVDDAWLDRVRAEVGELPSATRRRLATQYGLSGYDVGVLTSLGRTTVRYFEETARVCSDPKAAANWITNQLQGTLKDTGLSLEELPVTAARLGGLISKQKEMGLGKQAQAVYEKMLADRVDAVEAIAALGITVVADTGAVADIVRAAIAANPKAVADYKNGKAAAANAIKGAIMRQTKGSVRIDVVERVLKEELDKA